MWTKIADFIIKNRLLLIAFIALVTAFMAYNGSPERAYDYSSTVPMSDPDMQYFLKFKEKYGEDGNILAIGLRDSAVYQLENFTQLEALSEAVLQVEGVAQVVSLPRLQYLYKDTTEKVFQFRSIFNEMPRSQVQLDSVLTFVKTLQFYRGQIINEENGATALLISIESEILNSGEREDVMAEIFAHCKDFEQATDIKLRYAGLPFVRSVMATQVTDELSLFLGLSLLTTAIVLFLFFRSFSAVFFPILVIGVIVVWTLGTLDLLGYKITLLTGLLPPVLVVIGIPNCVYMLTKYHQAYRKSGDKIFALKEVIKQIGVVSLMTNLTTATGFVVLGVADIAIMREFGIVAGINIICAYFICMILIPTIFSYLPAPKSQHLKHLDARFLVGILKQFDYLVLTKKAGIFITTVLIIAASLWGLWQIRTISYMVDEIPEKSQVRKDLAFFEENFMGVMPLEIVVNTGKEKGIRRVGYLRKIDEFQQSLDSMSISTPSLSAITFLKAARQAYYNNDPAFYGIPDNREYAFLTKYLQGEEANASLTQAFLDSTGQEVRISLKIADIGSIKMDSLIKEVIQPKIDRIFKNQEDFEVHVTGTTPIFIKGNAYLIKNLKMTIGLAVLLVGIIMSLLFRSFRMIIIVIFANCVPMLITAGLMGAFGVPLKPSTALIFSIAFGISVDDAIHYLARYRYELLGQDRNVLKAVRMSLRDTGQGMLYTSVILFFGFIIFTGSDFGGTVALGMLTSITLIFAKLTNLVLLPALLLTFEKGARTTQSPEAYEQFYLEDEDEEIDVNKIEVTSPSKKE